MLKSVLSDCTLHPQIKVKIFRKMSEKPSARKNPLR